MPEADAPASHTIIIYIACFIWIPFVPHPCLFMWTIERECVCLPIAHTLSLFAEVNVCIKSGIVISKIPCAQVMCQTMYCTGCVPNITHYMNSLTARVLFQSQSPRNSFKKALSFNSLGDVLLSTCLLFRIVRGLKVCGTGDVKSETF